MKLIVGLGNPGTEYKDTRHNIGWLVVDALTKKLGADGWKHDDRFEAYMIEIASPSARNDKLLFIKPTTFMNNSGRAVERARAYYKLEPADVIAVHDDLDLMLGTVRVRLGGQTAGHNGVGSLIHHLGTDQFWRVRIGIGSDHPERHADTTSFVLKPFSSEERGTVDTVVDQVASFLVQSLTSGTLEDTTLTI